MKHQQEFNKIMNAKDAGEEVDMTLLNRLAQLFQIEQQANLYLYDYNKSFQEEYQLCKLKNRPIPPIKVICHAAVSTNIKKDIELTLPCKLFFTLQYLDGVGLGLFKNQTIKYDGKFPLVIIEKNDSFHDIITIKSNGYSIEQCQKQIDEVIKEYLKPLGKDIIIDGRCLVTPEGPQNLHGAYTPTRLYSPKNWSWQ